MEGITFESEIALNANESSILQSQLFFALKDISSIIEVYSQGEVTEEKVKEEFSGDKYKEYIVEVFKKSAELFEIKLSAKENTDIFGSKLVLVRNISLRQYVSVHSSTSTNTNDPQPVNDHLIDVTSSGKINEETEWRTDAEVPVVVLELSEPRKIDSFLISFGLNEGGWGYYPVDFNISAGMSLDNMSTVYSKNGNYSGSIKEKFASSYLGTSTPEAKFIKLEITQRSYFSDIKSIAILGIELYEDSIIQYRTLSLDYNGGTFEGKDTDIRKYRRMSILSDLESIIPTRENFDFAGFVDENGYKIDKETVISRNLKAFAKWNRSASANQNKFNVTIKLNGGKVNNSINDFVFEVYENEKIIKSQLPIITRDDYAFKQFVIEESGLPFNFDEVITQNINLKATYFGEEDEEITKVINELNQIEDVLPSSKNTLELVKEHLGETTPEDNIIEVEYVSENERYIQFRVKIISQNDSDIYASKLIRVYKEIKINKFAKIEFSSDTYRFLTPVENLMDENSDNSQNLDTEFIFSQINEENYRTNNIEFIFGNSKITKVKLYLQNPNSSKHHYLSNFGIFIKKENGHERIDGVEYGVEKDFIEFDIPEKFDSVIGLRLRILDQKGQLVRIHGIEIFGMVY